MFFTDVHKGLPYYTLMRASHAVYSRVAPCGRPWGNLSPYLNSIGPCGRPCITSLNRLARVGVRWSSLNAYCSVKLDVTSWSRTTARIVPAFLSQMTIDSPPWGMNNPSLFSSSVRRRASALF